MTRHRPFRASRLLILATAALALAIASGPVAAFASDTQAESPAQKSRGEGEDENIKDSSSANDPAEEAEAPPDKGGDASRAGCWVSVDNWTPWKVQIFVNGSYVGLIQRHGNGRAYYRGSRHTLYGVADFTDGSRLTWGPHVFSCRGSYTWKLTK